MKERNEQMIAAQIVWSGPSYTWKRNSQTNSHSLDSNWSFGNRTVWNDNSPDSEGIEFLLSKEQMKTDSGQKWTEQQKWHKEHESCDIITYYLAHHLHNMLS